MPKARALPLPSDSNGLEACRRLCQQVSAPLSAYCQRIVGRCRLLPLPRWHQAQTPIDGCQLILCCFRGSVPHTVVFQIWL